MIKAILAVDAEFGIGKNNTLPWHHSEDLGYFKEQTLDQVVVMGNSTWKSIPEHVRPLPSRTNVVIASKYDPVVHAGANIVITPDGMAIDGHLSSATKPGPEAVIAAFIGVVTHYGHADIDTWIMGGATIYKMLMPFVEELHLTIVPGTHECDTFYNPLEDNAGKFKLQSMTPLVNKYGKMSLVVGVYGTDNIQ